MAYCILRGFGQETDTQSKTAMIEIERKFLVRDDSWRGLGAGTEYRQGYLQIDETKSVRVRVAREKAFLTIKSGNRGLTRAEFEYPIPVEDAEELLKLCVGSPIEKTRYKIVRGDLVWEVDEFHGANTGLLIAEVELEREDQSVDLPDWVGEEVSQDSRYFNAYLALHPFSTWSFSAPETD